MISIMEPTNYLVVAFFLTATLLSAFLGQRFYALNKQPMRHFGTGLLFVSLAFAVWTYVVALHPANMLVATTLAVVPFFGSFIFFLLAAVNGVKVVYRAPLLAISGAILAGFVIARFFMFQSNPGFDENGFFEFNIDPVALYFYALIMSFNFIPAVYVVGRHIKHDLLRVMVELGLTLVSVGLIVMVTSTDDNLQVVNGIGILLGFIAAAGSVAAYGLTKKTIK